MEAKGNALSPKKATYGRRRLFIARRTAEVLRLPRRTGRVFIPFLAPPHISYIEDNGVYEGPGLDEGEGQKGYCYGCTDLGKGHDDAHRCLGEGDEDVLHERYIFESGNAGQHTLAVDDIGGQSDENGQGSFRGSREVQESGGGVGQQKLAQHQFFLSWRNLSFSRTLMASSSISVSLLRV